MRRTTLGLLALPTVVALSANAAAQGVTPMPDIGICLAAGGVNPLDPPPNPQCTDRIIMLRDLNDNGDYMDMPDEIAGFVDTGCFNATFTGIRAAEMQLEAGVPTVYWVDKTANAVQNPSFGCAGHGGTGVYRAQDMNGNGAIEAGETTLFRFVPQMTGFILEPNGVCGTDDGAIWYSDQIFSAPSASAGVWRLLDGNNDGDAEDGGEGVQLVASGQMVPSAGGPVVIDTSYMQTMTPEGNSVVVYSGTNINATDECLYRFEDVNGNGSLADAGDAQIFLNATGKNVALDANPDFGMGLPNKDLATNGGAHARLVNFGMAVQTTNVGTGPTWYLGTDSSDTSPTFSTNINGNSLNGLILRGIDMNADGDINDAGEVTTWYDGGFSGTNTIRKILGLEVIGNSVYVLDLAGGTFGVHQLTDLNNDGDALDTNEFQTVSDANLWGGGDPLGMCGQHSGPFVVDFEVIERGLWDPPGMPMSPFTDTCSGDGGNQMGCTDCPCGNNSAMGTVGGCLNSAGTSTRLIASGDTSVSLPSGSTTDLQFAASGSPPGATNVLISGNAIAPQNMANPCFGLDSGAQAVDRDGLRCAVQVTIRHGNRAANGMGDIMDPSGPNRVWGGPAQPTVGLAAQGGFMSGQTRFFQITHRDDAMAVCMRGLNTSQAVGVTFTP